MAREAAHASILIVDDEQSVRDSIERVLEREGYQVFKAANAHEAEDILQKETVALVLTDLRMPDVSGLELLRQVKKQFPDIEVVMITGHGTIERAVEAMKEGAYDFITKPFKRAEILRAVSKALEKRNLAQDNRILREQLETSYASKVTFI
ncbi:MAG: sigma-54-dependent Fis family transcriptional regulator, partial [Calditrichaeota bacterium]